MLFVLVLVLSIRGRPDGLNPLGICLTILTHLLGEAETISLQ